MQVSFGPRSNVYHAYVKGRAHKLPPGTTGPVTDVETFYKQTRKRSFPGTFSFITLFAPLATFAAAIKLIFWQLSSGSKDLLEQATPLAATASDPALPIDTFCKPNKGYDPLINGLFAGTMRFSVTHVALLAVCTLALFAAAASMRNVLETHRVLGESPQARVARWILALLVPIGAGYLVFFVTARAVGARIDGLFERLFPVPADLLNQCETLSTVRLLNEQLYVQMGWGAKAVSIGVVSLILAAALLGWRFERKDINGAWSDSYVLRHKINNALTLFFIGSMLLVVMTIALASATDWTTGVLDAVKAATASESGLKDPSSGGSSPSQSGTGGATAPTPITTPAPNTKGVAAATSQSAAAGVAPAPAPAPDTQGAGAAAKVADPAAEFNSLKILKTSISTFAGALGSLVLILIFVPALYSLTGEIEIAGKTHASYDIANKNPPAPAAPTPPSAPAPAKPAPPPAILFATADDGTIYEFQIVAAPGDALTEKLPTHEAPRKKIEVVAGWKTVQDWKESHGLKLSFSDMTGTFVAVLAPLLSGSIIDLTKIGLG